LNEWVGHHNKTGVINGKHCLPCFVLLVLIAAADKIHFEEQALVAGTKQSRKANMAVKPACFVLCPLLALIPQSGFLPTNILLAIHFP
jgi:hypothetical protein